MLPIVHTVRSFLMGSYYPPLCVAIKKMLIAIILMAKISLVAIAIWLPTVVVLVPYSWVAAKATTALGPIVMIAMLIVGVILLSRLTSFNLRKYGRELTTKLGIPELAEQLFS